MGTSTTGRVTFWTITEANEHDHGPEGMKLFRGHDFTQQTAGLVRQCVFNNLAKWPSDGRGISLSIVEIHDVAPWLPQALHASFPGFPLDLLRPMIQSPEFNNALLPLGRSLNEFSFFTKYTVIQDKCAGENTMQDHTFDSCEVRSIPVAVWISSSTVILKDSDRIKVPIPIIVLVCQSPIVRQKLEQHLAVDFPRRLHRLIDSPCWIYMDLSFLLSQWQEVWEVASGSIVLRDAQLTGEIPTLSFLDLTQRLHHDCNSVVMLQEGLRLHISAMKVFQRFIKAQRTNERKKRFSIQQGDVSVSLCVVSSQHQVELENRIEDFLQNLENNQETSRVIFKQLEILQSLAFNTETVRQGYTVARLNYLAIAFLPLSYVSSLFSIPQFSISIVWYPLWAFVCIALVFAVSGLFARRSRARKTREKSRPWAFQQWEMPILRVRANDSTAAHCRSTLLNSFYPQNYSDTAKKVSSLEESSTQSTSTRLSDQVLANELGKAMRSADLGDRKSGNNQEPRLNPIPEARVAENKFPFTPYEPLVHLNSSSRLSGYFPDAKPNWHDSFRFSATAAGSVTGAGHHKY